MTDEQPPSRRAPQLAALQRLGRGLDALASGLAKLGGLLIVVLMLMIVTDVAMRAIAGQPLPGTIGISQVMVAVAIYMAFAHTQRTDGNIRVELVLMRLPERPRRAFEVISRTLVAAASSFLAYYAIRPALRSIRVNEHWVGSFIDVPMWPARVALVIGAGVLALVSVRVILLRDDATSGEVGKETP